MALLFGLAQASETADADAQHRLDTSFPADLPVPTDDGLYDHLHANFEIPNSISLPVAREPNVKVTLADLPGLTILFLYPRTGTNSNSQL